ncbi:MAG: hypothetical protein JNK89_01970, partial [Saprospiraceae bacterium]|nr:hypothetical protein [Saprospiraceae bacterium]
RQTLRGIANTPTTTFYQHVFSEHMFEVEALAFSPDGQLVASGSFDKSLAIWQRDGTLLSQLQPADAPSDSAGFTATVHAVEFEPGGQAVWAAGQDGRVKKVDLEGRVLTGFAAHQAAVWDMALAPDGRWLVTASSDSTAAVWSAGGVRLHQLCGHRDAVRTAAISPDGRWIATGSNDGTARLWTAGGQLQQVFDLGGAKVNASAFSPDSRQLLLGCGDNTAKLFSLDGRLAAIYGGHTAEITEVAFSPDGKQVLTASNDHTAKLWQRSGEEVLRLVGHTERVGALAVSADGNWVATGSFDYTAKIWNLPFNLNNKAARHKGPVTKVAVSPNGRFVLSGSEDNTAKLWNLDDGALKCELSGHRKEIPQVGFAPAGDRFFTTSLDGTVRIWDTSGVLHLTLNQFPGRVVAADFSPADDGALVATCGPEIFLIDRAGQTTRRWKAHSSAISRAAFSPDGQRVLSAGQDEWVKIWSLEGILLDSLPILPPVNWAGFSPDGQYVVTSARERPIREWKNSLSAPRQYVGHLDVSFFVGYSPDGRFLVSCNWDKTARIWDRQTGAIVQVFPHPDGVNGAAFTPDGRLLITACRDKFVRVWDRSNGRLLRVFGDDPDVGRFLESEHIAALETIPFSFERYGIASDMAASIYGDQPELLRSMGQRYLEQANNRLHDLAAGQEASDKAEFYFNRAARLQGAAARAMSDSLLAEVYLFRANLYLSNGKYTDMLQAAERGIGYRSLPMLQVYKTFGLLLSNRFDKAKNLALELCKDSTTAVPPYYESYRQALSEEQFYYESELGIQHPDWVRLMGVIDAGR